MAGTVRTGVVGRGAPSSVGMCSHFEELPKKEKDEEWLEAGNSIEYIGKKKVYVRTPAARAARKSKPRKLAISCAGSSASTLDPNSIPSPEIKIPDADELVSSVPKALSESCGSNLCRNDSSLAELSDQVPNVAPSLHDVSDDPVFPAEEAKIYHSVGNDINALKEKIENIEAEVLTSHENRMICLRDDVNKMKIRLEDTNKRLEKALIDSVAYGKLLRVLERENSTLLEYMKRIFQCLMEMDPGKSVPYRAGFDGNYNAYMESRKVRKMIEETEERQRNDRAIRAAMAKPLPLIKK